MVGVEGFEPPTLWSQTRCATKLRYTPIFWWRPAFYSSARRCGAYNTTKTQKCQQLIFKKCDKIHNLLIYKLFITSILDRIILTDDGHPDGDGSACAASQMDDAARRVKFI